MRDEDERFADIVQQEFDEPWSPTPAPATPGPAAPVEPGPAPDFQLNLYDDEESYREVSPLVWTLTPPMRWGLILVFLGVILAGAIIVFRHTPQWFGWLAVACFIAGVAVCLWQITHSPRDNDEAGTV